MPREGGYGRSTKAEWLKTDRKSYAAAITSADQMGQTLEVWLADAIAFHAYYCERLEGRERYAEAVRAAEARRDPTPVEADYRPKGPAPTITRSAPGGMGEGSGPGRSYRR